MTKGFVSPMCLVLKQRETEGVPYPSTNKPLEQSKRNQEYSTGKDGACQARQSQQGAWLRFSNPVSWWLTQIEGRGIVRFSCLSDRILYGAQKESSPFFSDTLVSRGIATDWVG